MEELAVQGRTQKLANTQSRIAELGREIQNLENRMAACTEETQQHEREQKAAEADTAALQEQLKPYAKLDAELSAEQQKQSTSQPGYEAWLRAREVAALLDSRQAALADCRQKEEAGRAALEAARLAHHVAVKASTLSRWPRPIPSSRPGVKRWRGCRSAFKRKGKNWRRKRVA